MVRFTVWMTLGLIMYFYYGITHSTLENAQEEIELTVDQSFLDVPQTQHKQNNNHHQPTAVWDRHGYENKMAEDSWSTTNNYSTNSWDVNETKQGWGESASSKATASIPAIASTTSKTKLTNKRPNSQRQTTAAQSVPPPPPPASSAPPAAPAPKSGFGGIFIDETQFPTWDD